MSDEVELITEVVKAFGDTFKSVEVGECVNVDVNIDGIEGDSVKLRVCKTDEQHAYAELKVKEEGKEEVLFKINIEKYPAKKE